MNRLLPEFSNNHLGIHSPNEIVTLLDAVWSLFFDQYDRQLWELFNTLSRSNEAASKPPNEIEYISEYRPDVDSFSNLRQLSALQVFSMIIQFSDLQKQGSYPKLYEYSLLESFVTQLTEIEYQPHEVLELAQSMLKSQELLEILFFLLVSHRHLARGMDRSLFISSPKEPFKVLGLTTSFKKQLPVHIDEDGHVEDPLGGWYYFWTQAFAGVYFAQHPSLFARFAEFIMPHGTAIMEFVRAKIAGQPVIKRSHRAYSAYGVEFAKAILRKVGEKTAQTTSDGANVACIL